MSGTSTGIESVKAIPFSGLKPRKYREWNKKVLAFAKTKGWALALTDESNSKCTQKMVDNALNFLTMCLTDKAFAFVEHAKSPSVVWSELKDEYSPGEDIDIYDLQEDFSECKLSHEKENPADWFKRVEHISEMLSEIDPKFRKTDEELKIHLKVNLPKSSYSELLTSIRPSFRSMSYKDLKKQVKAHWRAFTRDRGMDVEQQDEKVLAVGKKNGAGSWRQFKGRCHICGGIGHKANECPSNHNKNNGCKYTPKKFRGRCFKCGKIGHMARDCKENGGNKQNMFVGATIAKEDDLKVANDSMDATFPVDDWITVPSTKTFTDKAKEERMEEKANFVNYYAELNSDPSVGDPPTVDDESTVDRLFEPTPATKVKRKLKFDGENHHVNVVTHQTHNVPLKNRKFHHSNRNQRKDSMDENTGRKKKKLTRSLQMRKKKAVPKRKRYCIETNLTPETQSTWTRKKRLLECRCLLKAAYEELVEEIDKKEN